MRSQGRGSQGPSSVLFWIGAGVALAVAVAAAGWIVGAGESGSQSTDPRRSSTQSNLELSEGERIALDRQTEELCTAMEDEVAAGAARGYVATFINTNASDDLIIPRSQVVSVMRESCGETLAAWETAASALSPEADRAMDLCDVMDRQVARGAVQTHLNHFLQRNANGVNVPGLLTAMRNRCGQTVSAYEDAYSAEFERSQRESLAERADEEPWWEALPQPLGNCYRQYHEARYLSSQALTAAVCIADEIAFGGTTPTSEAVRNLTGDILFHATWATWDDASRRAHCGPIKARGFDAAEDLGIETIRTWNAQLAAAGASKQFDDYAIVLDFLDVCESY